MLFCQLHLKSVVYLVVGVSVVKRTKPHADALEAQNRHLIARASDVGPLKVLPADPVGRYNEFFDETTLSQSGLKDKSFTAMWAGALG